MKYQHLKFEDEQKLRASVVLDYYKQEVESINDDDLSLAEREIKG